MLVSKTKISWSLYLILSILRSPFYVFGAEWSYDDMDHWEEDFPKCGMTNQSPVDITKAVFDDNLGPFKLVNFDNVDGVSWTLSNNGHTAQVTYTGGDVRLSWGGLPGEYKVAQFHFHWGNDDAKGSEHTYYGQHFPLEMQVVTYKTEYGSLIKALDHDDGLAVLGVFFQESDIMNYELKPLISNLKSVKNPDQNTTVTPIPLADLLRDLDFEKYYRYEGSLTAPPCLEVVTWTVFPKSPLKISEDQLEQFRALLGRNGGNIVNNFRPTQPLFGRVISSSE